MEPLREELEQGELFELPEVVASDARSLAERVAEAMDRAPDWMRSHLLDLGETNRRRLKAGLPMITGEGYEVPHGAKTLGHLLHED